MNGLARDLQGAWIACLGWTLLHFVWQGALVGLAHASAQAFLRKRSAPARYAVALTGLGALAFFPCFTIVAISMTSGAGSGDGGFAAAPGDVPDPIGAPGGPTGPAGMLDPLAWIDPSLRIRGALEQALPWCVLGWGLGVTVLSVRLLGGWVRVERIRRRARPMGGELAGKLAALAARLRVDRVPGLLQSAHIDVPAVVGVVRRAILLPASAVVGLTPTQLDPIVLHELAHLHRHDYLVNLLQSIVEAVLFYHPAVWLVSRTLRIERESCADDLAVEACGDRAVYAKALRAIEELRLAGSILAPAATGGSVLSRVRRLSGTADPMARGARLAPTAALVGVGLVGAALGLGARAAERAPDPGLAPPAAPAAASEADLTVRGRILDEQGVPIARATVRWGRPPAIDPYVAETDSEGRFVLQPRVPGFLILTASAPGRAARLTAVRAEAAREPIELRLETGLDVSGRVADDHGAPVSGATVRFDPANSARGEVTTDAAGRFALPPVARGALRLLFLAPRRAPALERVTVEPGLAPVEVRLEPGRTVLGRVVDPDGRPVVGAWVVPDEWRGEMMLTLVRLETDAEGRFRWDEAPPDPVRFDVVQDGWMSIRRRTVVPSETEQVFALGRLLRIRGRILDASSGASIDDATLSYGIVRTDGRFFGFPSTARAVHGGAYEVVIDMPLTSYRGPRLGYSLRAEAPGYAPSRSRVVADDEGDLELDIRLEPAGGAPRNRDTGGEEGSPRSRDVRDEHRSPKGG